MRSVARRVQFVNRLMRLESDYLEEAGERARREEGKEGPKEGEWSRTTRHDEGAEKEDRLARREASGRTDQCWVAVNEFVSSTSERPRPR